MLEGDVDYPAQVRKKEQVKSYSHNENSTFLTCIYIDV